jgi:hypothetical protein
MRTQYLHVCTEEPMPFVWKHQSDNKKIESLNDPYWLVGSRSDTWREETLRIGAIQPDLAPLPGQIA